MINFSGTFDLFVTIIIDYNINTIVIIFYPRYLGTNGDIQRRKEIKILGTDGKDPDGHRIMEPKSQSDKDSNLNRGTKTGTKTGRDE